MRVSVLLSCVSLAVLTAAEPTRRAPETAPGSRATVTNKQPFPVPVTTTQCIPALPHPTEPATLRSLQMQLLALQQKIDEMSVDVSYTRGKVDESYNQVEQLIRSSMKTSCAEVAGDGPVELVSSVGRPGTTRQNSMDGVYAIYPSPGRPKRVRCEHSSTGDPGWMVVLLRQSGAVEFDRNYNEYINGFGDPNAEVWIGLDTLHILTDAEPQQLRVELRNFAGEFAFAQYSDFSVGPKSSQYKLTVGGYDRSSTAGDALKDHNNMRFSTVDMDHDLKSGSCAAQFGGDGGWWYATCYHALGTGRYRRPAHPGLTQTSTEYGGIAWHPFIDVKRSLQMFRMLIKPRAA